MSKLRQLLSYLERPGITQLVFRTGAPALMCSESRQHPLTITPLSSSQIRRFFRETDVLDSLSSQGEAPPRSDVTTLLGRNYQVTLSGSRHSFELRLAPAADATEPRGPATRKLEAIDEPPSGPILLDPAIDSESSGTYSVRGDGESSGTYSVRGDGESSGTYSVRGDGESSGTYSVRGDGESSGTYSVRGDGESSGTYSVRPDTPTASKRARSGPWAAGRKIRGTPGSTPGRGTSETSGIRPPQQPSALSDDASIPIERNADVHSDIHTSRTAQDIPAVAAPQPIPVPEESSPIRLDRPRPAPAPVPDTLDDPRPGPTPIPGTPPRRFVTRGPIHETLLKILEHARQSGATDAHLLAGEAVRVRTAGALRPVGPPVSPSEVQRIVDSVLEPRHQQQLDERGYTDLAIDADAAGRVRLNINRQRTGLKLCARLVCTSPPSLDDLGLPSAVRDLTGHHQGLVLIAGPNGHGKTTTMSALVDLFNATRAMHIVTVEDPVEVIHPRKRAVVTQREVGAHTRSFGTALAGALRQDPDVIAIGELRDRETTQMALAASETGHLVLATMSTPSAAKTIDRVIAMFPPDEQSQIRATMAGALKLVLSQRLLPTADGQGMVAAYEMLTGTVPLWSLIRDNKLFQLPSLQQRGRAHGIIRLDESLRELVERGAIERKVALLHAEDPRNLSASGRA